MRPGQCPCGWLLSWWLVYLGDFWDIYSKALNVNSQNMKLGICGTYLWRLFVQIINDRITLMLRGSNRPKRGWISWGTRHNIDNNNNLGLFTEDLFWNTSFSWGFDRCHHCSLDNCCFPKESWIVQLNPVLQHMDLHGTNPLKPPAPALPLDNRGTTGTTWTVTVALGLLIASPWKWKSQSWVKLIILVTSSN